MFILKDRKLWSITDYLASFKSEENSLEDYWSIFQSEIEHNPNNAFITTITDVKSKQNDSILKLSSIPIALKDNICTLEFPTTCASKMLKNWNSPYESHVASLLKNEGSLLIGKTNLDEFAMGNTTVTSYFGRVYNPWDTKKRFSPGGSSGGSSVAVASGIVPVSIGSDTGGSIRCPASWTGVSGLKPTYGRVSRFGLIAYGHTLDQIGVLGRYIEDISYILDIISQPQSQNKDLTYEFKPYIHGSLRLNETITVGIPTEIIENLPIQQKKLIKNAIEIFETIPGIVLQDIILDELDIMLPTYYITALSEVYSNLVRYTGEQYGFSAGDALKTRIEGFGSEIKRRMSLGAYSLEQGYEGQLYQKAQDIRDYFRNKYTIQFKETPVIALPTMNDFAIMWDEFQSPLDSYKADLLTVLANLIGAPALSLPIGFGTKNHVKLPYGIQLISGWWQEILLLKIAWEFQQQSNFHLKLPPS